MLRGFPIEIRYEDTIYFGAVHATLQQRQISYVTSLETEDPTTRFDFILRRADSASVGWDFLSANGENVAESYDKNFLRKIGDGVKACLR